MNTFEAETIDEIYPEIIDKILSETFETSPRGFNTKDIGLTAVKINKPYQRLITNKNRKINPYFLFAEFLWIATQQNRVEMLGFYNKKMYDFSDDGKTLYGAYGPRLMRQIPTLINKIRLDPNTRQAVASIFKPNDQLVSTKDFPCNILLHFLPRNGVLTLITYVRSQDIFLGLPYDFYHWSLLLEMVAAETNMEVGSMTHICGSLHAYERDFQYLEKIATEDSGSIEILEPTTSGLIQNIRAISTIEFRNRKSRIDESTFTQSLNEIQSLKEDQLIKDQLASLLYYKVRRNQNFGISKNELLDSTGTYAKFLQHLGWD